LPWTLNDPENWRRTHHLAAKIWLGAGLVIFLISFVFSSKMLLILFSIILLLIVLIPGVYSYKMFHHSNKAHG
jgi:uncharacterized membrane protein